MSTYASGKPYVVPGRLDVLVGPSAGRVRLPRHIDWGPEHAYDLGDVGDAAVMYERVIREAQSERDLAELLDARTLRRLWPRLVLPARARELWEARFPELVDPA